MASKTTVVVNILEIKYSDYTDTMQVKSRTQMLNMNLKAFEVESDQDEDAVMHEDDCVTHKALALQARTHARTHTHTHTHTHTRQPKRTHIHTHTQPHFFAFTV